MSRKYMLVSIGFLVLLVVLYIQLFIFGSVRQAEKTDRQQGSRMIVISKDNDLIYQHLRKSTAEAAKQYHINVENQTLQSWESTTLRDSVVFAIYSGAQAVAFQSSDPMFTQEMYELASDQGVQLILYESENYQRDTIPAVSANSYSIGTSTGQLAIDASGEEGCKAVLVLEKTQEGIPSTYQNMKVQGIMEVFGQYDNAEIVQTLSTEEEVYAGEKLANTLEALKNTYNTIICLNAYTVPLIAQQVIDSNLVDKVQIIGYGMQQQTLDYVSRGVIYGTVTPDPDQMGNDIVAMLHTWVNNHSYDDNMPVPLHTITRENVDKFSRQWLETEQ